jgi:hypothetical protein
VLRDDVIRGDWQENAAFDRLLRLRCARCDEPDMGARRNSVDLGPAVVHDLQKVGNLFVEDDSGLQILVG